MRTEDLIVSLAADARPVRVLATARARFVQWAVLSMLSTAVALWLTGARADLSVVMTRGSWTAELMLLGAAAVIAGVAAQLSAVPGAAGARAARAGALAALGLWAGLLATRLAAVPAPLAAWLAEPAHMVCALRIVAIATVPAAMAWWQLRRAAALQPGWSAALAAAAALTAAAAATQVICPLDHAAHVVSWHLLPVAVLTSASAAVARSLVAS